MSEKQIIKPDYFTGMVEILGDPLIVTLGYGQINTNPYFGVISTHLRLVAGKNFEIHSRAAIEVSLPKDVLLEMYEKSISQIERRGTEPILVCSDGKMRRFDEIEGVDNYLATLDLKGIRWRPLGENKNLGLLVAADHYQVQARTQPGISPDNEEKLKLLEALAAEHGALFDARPMSNEDRFEFWDSLRV